VKRAGVLAATDVGGPTLRGVVGILLVAVGALVVATFSYVTVRTEEAGYAAQRESEFKLVAGRFEQVEVSVRAMLHQADAYLQIKDPLQAQNALRLVGVARDNMAELQRGGRAISTRELAARALAHLELVAAALQPVQTEQELRGLEGRLAQLDGVLGALVEGVARLEGQLATERRAVGEFYAERIEASKRTALVMVPLALAAALLGGYLFYRLVVAPLEELGQATVLALQPEGTFRLDPAAPGCREIRQARAGAFQLFRQLGGLVQERTARLEEALQQSAERQRQLAVAEREARSNEARFTEVFRTTSSGLLLTDGTGRALLANPAAAQILRSGEQQTVGRHLIDLLVDGGFASDRPALSRFLAAADPEAVFRLERRGRGAEFFGELQLHKFSMGEVRGQLAQITDITQRETMLQAEFRAQRMESIGALSSGIAHDLNNSLAPITMATEMLRLRYPDENALLSVIEQSSHRSSAMVKQLVSFAKGTAGERRTVSSARLISELAAMIRSTFPGNIAVETEVAADLPDVLGESTQLFQVLLNLSVNARDAMPQGGCLRITARPRQIAPGEQVGAASPKPGAYVEWAVADTGVGMTREVLARIFDPFFTTKGPEHGTGLGLATSLGIIRRAEGVIGVASAPAQGTTFRVLLPVAPRSAEAVAELALPAPDEIGAGETVLVVDDEAALRETTQLLLAGANYRVVVAADGAEALRRVEELRDRLAVVITDLNMPGLDGLGLATELRRRGFRMPVVVSGGLLGEAESRAFRAVDVEFFLNKPFSRADLFAALRRALATGAPARR
jgi:PAS domain S-box-containing protein